MQLLADVLGRQARHMGAEPHWSCGWIDRTVYRKSTELIQAAL